jgi:hypothetical protein
MSKTVEDNVQEIAVIRMVRIGSGVSKGLRKISVGTLVLVVLKRRKYPDIITRTRLKCNLNKVTRKS